MRFRALSFVLLLTLVSIFATDGARKGSVKDEPDNIIKNLKKIGTLRNRKSPLKDKAEESKSDFGYNIPQTFRDIASLGSLRTFLRDESEDLKPDFGSNILQTFKDIASLGSRSSFLKDEAEDSKPDFGSNILQTFKDITSLGTLRSFLKDEAEDSKPDFGYNIPQTFKDIASLGSLRTLLRDEAEDLKTEFGSNILQTFKDIISLGTRRSFLKDDAEDSKPDFGYNIPQTIKDIASLGSFRSFLKDDGANPKPDFGSNILQTFKDIASLGTRGSFLKDEAEDSKPENGFNILQTFKDIASFGTLQSLVKDRLEGFQSQGGLQIINAFRDLIRETDPTLTLRKIMNVFRPPESIEFFLYTASNPKTPQQLRLGDIDSFVGSNFNASHPTRFTIHGWMSDSEQDVSSMVRDAYLSRGPHNIIAVNWVAESVKLYDLSIKHVPRIGLRLGELIDFMAENGWVQPENITLVGHSLGAHISGIAARSLDSGQIHTIVALDPASPGFSYDVSKYRLRQSDAYYVESIQTCSGTLGYVEPIGKATFYPNGGAVQPNCGLDPIKSCCHFRSYVYFSEAIRHDGFPSISCQNYADALNMDCGNEFSKTIRMGNPKNADIASGTFFVPISPHPPYFYE